MYSGYVFLLTEEWVVWVLREWQSSGRGMVVIVTGQLGFCWFPETGEEGRLWETGWVESFVHHNGMCSIWQWGSWRSKSCFQW